MKKQSQSGSGLKPYADKAKSAKLNVISAKSDMPAKQLNTSEVRISY